jgi:hypothetical protein
VASQVMAEEMRMVRKAYASGVRETEGAAVGPSVGTPTESS